MIPNTELAGDMVHSRAAEDSAGTKSLPIDGDVLPRGTKQYRTPPLLVRRWRSGKVVWEGQPDSPRLLYRYYPVCAVGSHGAVTTSAE